MVQIVRQTVTFPFLYFDPASLPKLQEFDWRIDVKTSSDTISRMSAPTCLLQLKVIVLQLTAVGIHWCIVYPHTQFICY